MLGRSLELQVVHCNLLKDLEVGLVKRQVYGGLICFLVDEVWPQFEFPKCVRSFSGKVCS